MRLKSSNNLHGHSFSQLQIMPASSQNVRNCNSKLFKPLLQIAAGSTSELQRRAQFNSGLTTSKAETEAALAISSDLNQPYTQISTIEERQLPYNNDGVIRLTDDAVITDDHLTETNINDRSTCKRAPALQHHA